MYRPKDNLVTFRYNSLYKDKLSKVELNRSFDIYVEVISSYVMKVEDYKVLRDEFKDFLENYETGDIVEVIEKLNTIFKDVPQTRLRATIRSKEHTNIQEVEYTNGILEFYHFSKQYWDDVIYVFKNHKGTDIKYKKDGINVQTMEDVNFIYDELNQVFEKVFKLHELEKGKNISKTGRQI